MKYKIHSLIKLTNELDNWYLGYFYLTHHHIIFFPTLPAYRVGP